MGTGIGTLLGVPKYLRAFKAFGESLRGEDLPQVVEQPFEKFKHSDITKAEWKIIHAAQEHTKTALPVERLLAISRVFQYLAKNNIAGDYAECGVFGGGSSVISILSMDLYGLQKELYLFDTYAGLPEPSDNDYTVVGATNEFVAQKYTKKRAEDDRDWLCHATLDEVKKNVSTATASATQLPIHYIEGLVEDTLPQNAPDKVAVLHIDLDWYEPTKHVMQHLYDRLSVGGVLILDDYGYWKGASDAVDEVLAEKNARMFLHRTDYSGRIGVKLA